MSLMSPSPPRQNLERNPLFETPNFHGVERFLAQRGQSIVDVLAPNFAPGLHYPDGEVWDSVTDAQFFYHAHLDGARIDGEHGHFHTFLGAAGMPAGVTPLVLPEMGFATGGKNRDEPQNVTTHRTRRDRGVFSHLIGISIDSSGRPLQLFTTNRWVTGETWYRAEDVVRMLPRFVMSQDDSDASLIGCWLSGLMQLLRPVVIDLLAQRDTCMMDWRRRRSRSNHVFDDRRLEIMSSRAIDKALIKQQR